ncbi:MAG: DMT family transporter [Candidatus Buchananbacteria bacterium]|nr:DMT family transporter [Candidatus Buchananbacteria bacterium]
MIKKILWAPLLIIFAAFLWALDGVVLRPILYTLPVSLVVLTEHALAFIVMLPFLLRAWPELKKLKSMDWTAFLWVALFGGVLGTMLITKALFYVNYVNLAVVILIQKLQPVFALILARVFLKEKMPKVFFFWAVVAIIGTYFIAFQNFIPTFTDGGRNFMAILCSLGAAFAWGSSTVFSKRALQNANYKISTYLRFGLTTLLMLGVVSFSGTWSSYSQVAGLQWLIFILIVFSSGGAAMLIYYYGLKQVKASVSTICELAFPLSAIILEFIFRGQLLTWSQWLGTIVMLIAIYQVSLMTKNSAKIA